jgi:hypothetical protein
MSEEEVKELLFQKFLVWMRGQTTLQKSDGSIFYYTHDVNNYVRNLNSPIVRD